MAQVSFGTILREARIRKGYDLSVAARSLRIRPDILRTIEESDYAHMPPRGYTRNMVSAYARLVGLDPAEMTRMYLDGAYAYQIGLVRSDARATPYPDTSLSRSTSSSRPTTSSRRPTTSSRRSATASNTPPYPDDTHIPSRPSYERSHAQNHTRPPRQNTFGRDVYDKRQDYQRNSSTYRNQRQDRFYLEGSPRPSRHSALPNSQYTNFYAGPKAPNPLLSKLPLLIAGAVILILLIVVLILSVGHKNNPTDDAPKVHITGITDTTKDGTASLDIAGSEMPKPVEVMPTKVTVEYKVDSGQEIYAVITNNGTETPQMMTGPVTEVVDVSDTWSFATWVTDAVHITVEGKPVKFDSVDESGMPVCTVNFQTYLDAWKEEHPTETDTTSDDASAQGFDSESSSANDVSENGVSTAATHNG